jgi:hypothetical protein
LRIIANPEEMKSLETSNPESYKELIDFRDKFIQGIDAEDLKYIADLKSKDPELAELMEKVINS